MPIKWGTPKAGEKREELKTVSFKADEETISYLNDIEASMRDVMSYGKRSVVIRRAIRELWERAHQQKGEV